MAGRTEAMVAEICGEFPRFGIVYKRNSLFSRVLDVALRAVTLGGQCHYMTKFHTVIGSTLYVPDCWDEMSDVDRVITLRHERVHLRQSRRYTAVGMAFLYLVPLLPLGLAYGRARLEWEAYAETVRATAELRGLACAEDPALRRHIIAQFLGPTYGWMWPFRAQLERWYDELLAEVRREAEAAEA
ncbi:MAG TPA: hypothetical protein VFS43_30585 [Polyangiaceae bacterium]|nr:hypothetical protein [Polyangiaceae bacterium]